MRLWDDERAQSVQIGAILLFGVLVISFASYQAVVIPNQNAEVEFNHNQQVQSQFQELRNAIVSSVSRSTGVSVSLDLGTTFPSRLVGLNPPPPSGTLETVGTTDPAVNLSVRNAVATDPETADYWNGSEREFTTGLLEYAPQYSEYDEAPVTVYDNTLLYNQFRNTNRSITGQRLVDGNRLTFVMLNGSLRENGADAASVDVQPISTPVEPTTVRDASGGNLSVSFPSRFPTEKWNETLAEEYDGTPGDDDERYVTNVSGSARPAGLYNITVTFESADYRMRLVKVGIGNDATDEPAAYLTELDGEGTSVQQGESTELTLGVRDAYANPVGNVAVNASGGTFEETNNRSESDNGGEVTFTYDATGVTAGTTQQLNFTLQDRRPRFDQSTPENVTVNVSVKSSGGSGGGGAYDVNWLTNGGNDLTLDLAGGSSVAKDLDAGASIAAEGLNFDYAVNNTSVATVDPGEGVTNSSGENRTTLTATQNGTAAIYVVSGGSSDVINVSVTDSGSGSGDTTAPTVNNFNPPDGSTESTEPNTITFDVSDSGSGVDLSTLEVTLSDSTGNLLTNAGLSNSNISESGGTVTIDLTGSNGANIDLADGDVSTDVTIDDNEGNTGSGSATFTLDTTPPSPSIDSVTTSGSGSNSDITVDWSATDNIELSGGSVNEVRLINNRNGNVEDTIQISPSGTSDSGSVTFTNVNTNNKDVVIEVTDSAGNSATDSTTV